MLTTLTKASHQRTWDTDDRALQSLYGLALWSPEETFKPKFGAGIVLPLRNMNLDIVQGLALDPSGTTILGEPQEQIQETIATPTALGWHFGHMDWILNNIKDIIRKSKGLIQASDFHQRFLTSAEETSTREFLCRRVLPLRRAALNLEHPLYVHNLPLHIVDFDISTSHFFSLSSQQRAIGVLPATVEAARFHSIPETEIRLLAPQVLWVVYYQCVHNHIAEPEQLRVALNGWCTFVDFQLRRYLFNTLEKYRSHLLDETVTHLLNEGAPRSLLLFQEHEEG